MAARRPVNPAAKGKDVTKARTRGGKEGDEGDDQQNRYVSSAAFFRAKKWLMHTVAWMAS